MSATRAKRIHEISDVVSTLDLTGDSDRFVVDRRDASGAWDNKQISATDLASQVISQVQQTSIATELTLKDGLAIEFFEEYSAGAISVFDKGYGWAANGVGSGCAIVSRTPNGNGGLTQKRLAIASGQYGRKFAWGDAWNRIQIAVLWRLNRASTFGPSAFYFGLCSGTANMAASASTDNFIGMRGPNNGATDATLAAGTRMSYFDINPSVRFVTRRGTTTTDLGSGAGSNGRHVPSTEGWLACYFIEISRPTFATDASSVTYSLGRQMTNLTQVEMSLGKNSLLEIFGDTVVGTMASGPLLIQVASNGSAGVTVSSAFDQSTGKLDTLNFTWDQAFDCELAALGARKIF